jgi:hypothetical protein
MKPGIYFTVYGNAAKVTKANAKTALDLDMNERIPIEMVTNKLVSGGK